MSKNTVSVGVFLLILVSPFAVFLIFGEPEPYEGRAFTDFPPASELIEDDIAARDQMADALFERSVFRRASITASNWFDRNVLGFNRSDQVISGSDGVLFFVPSLTSVNCEEDPRLNSFIKGLELVDALLEAGDVPVSFLSAPNKASYWRDAVTEGLAGHLAECYFQRSRQLEIQIEAQLDARYRSHLPGLEALLLEPGLVYRRVDTHWQPVAIASVAPDLVALVERREPHFESQPGIDVITNTRGDLARMLQLSPEDLRVFASAEVIARRRAEADSLGALNLTIVHDSFYAGIEQELREVFQGVSLLHIDQLRNVTQANLSNTPQPISDADRAVLETLAQTDHLIVAIVERNFLPSVVGDSNSGGASLNSPVGDFIIAHNARRAEEVCSTDNAVEAVQTISVANAQMTEDGWYRAGADPQINVAIDPELTSRSLCIHVEIEVRTAGAHQIFLPSRPEGASEVASFQRPHEAGAFDYRLLLPTAYTRSFRVDPVIAEGEGFRITSISAWPAG